MIISNSSFDLFFLDENIFMSLYSTMIFLYCFWICYLNGKIGNFKFNKQIEHFTSSFSFLKKKIF